MTQPGTSLRSGRIRQKTGSNRKNIDERSEPRGGQGRGKGQGYLSSSSWLASLADFFLPFPHGGAWSQTKLASINKMTSPTVTLPLKKDIEKELVAA